MTRTEHTSLTWREATARPRERNPYVRTATSPQTIAILKYLSIHGLSSAGQVHNGADIGATGWKPGDTSERLRLLAGQGKIRRMQADMFAPLEAAAKLP